MRVLVTGSVDWTDPAPLVSALDAVLRNNPDLVVITGMADGVDAIVRTWTAVHDVELLAEPLRAGKYPAPMHRYNERMLLWLPDLVIACKHDLDMHRKPDAGTEHMCRIATDAGVSVRWLQMGDETP